MAICQARDAKQPGKTKDSCLHLSYSADWGPPVCAVPKHEGMEARSGQSHDNKIALQVSFNPTAVNIMDLLHIFVINKQYLFQRVSNYF